MTSILPFVQIKKNVSLEDLKLETVDRLSLLRIGSNERVGSFEEMQSTLDFVIDRDNSGQYIGYIGTEVLNYATYNPAFILKPEVLFAATNITYGGGFPNIPIRLAISTFVTDEFYRSSKEEVIFRQLESVVESYENAFLHAFLFNYAYHAGTASFFRDAYSRLTSLYLDLEAGTENIYYHVPSFLLYGTTYEAIVIGSIADPSLRDASMQWFQTDDFINVRRRMVKVPMDPASLFISRYGLVSYGDYLVRSFKRYYFDVANVERVKDRTFDINLYRFVFERYSLMNIPAIRNQTNANFPAINAYVIPAVSVYMPSPSAFTFDYPQGNYTTHLQRIG